MSRRRQPWLEYRILSYVVTGGQATMQTAHEFFIHELNDMLDAERKLVEALDQQASESTNEQVRKGFEQHREQTETQVERLEQVFESLGEQPEATECAGIKGLKEEHDN